MTDQKLLFYICLATLVIVAVLAYKLSAAQDKISGYTKDPVGSILSLF